MPMDGCPKFDPEAYNTQLLTVEYLRFRMAEDKHTLALPLTTSIANTPKWKPILCKTQYEAYAKEQACLAAMEQLIKERLNFDNWDDDTYRKVLCDIVGEGEPTWDHFFAIYAFAGLVAVKATEEGKAYLIDDIAYVTADFINSRYSGWIDGQDGKWGSMLRYRNAADAARLANCGPGGYSKRNAATNAMLVGAGCAAGVVAYKVFRKD